MRVLVVEDEVRLAENIAKGLHESSGYAIDVVHDGEEAITCCWSGKYDLIVLDLMLPQRSGEDILSKLRSAKDQTPVLILTAISDTSRIIDLLNLGADDYLAKPFDLGEMIARCRALIRRGKGAAHPVLSYGDLSVSTGEQSVTVKGQPVVLSPTEYRILEYLMYRPRIIVSKEALLEHLYDFTWQHHSNVIEAHISNLRKKLRAHSPEADLLETSRGRGYRLAEP